MRISIYLPPELARLVKERPDINWSKIAQEAFAETLEKNPRRDILFVSTPIKEKGLISDIDATLKCKHR